MEIYIITTGSYSARDIDKVFTDATKAKEYMELLYKRGTTDADLNIWDTSDNEKSFIQYMVAYQFPIKTVPAGNCGRVRTIREGSPVLTQLPGGATVTS